MIRRVALCALILSPTMATPSFILRGIKDAAMQELNSSARGLNRLAIPGGIGALSGLCWAYGTKKATSMSQGSRAATGLALGGIVAHLLTEGRIWNELETIVESINAFRIETKENFETTWSKIDQGGLIPTIKDYLVQKKSNLTADEQALYNYFYTVSAEQKDINVLTNQQKDLLIQIARHCQAQNKNVMGFINNENNTKKE